jgi:hypothetical protein
MKPFTTIAAIVFALVALLHVVRLVQGWVVAVDGVTIPMWVSPLGIVIAGGLAFLLWREAKV